MEQEKMTLTGDNLKMINAMDLEWCVYIKESFIMENLRITLQMVKEQQL